LNLRVPSHVDSIDLVRDAMRAWLAGVPLERGQAENVVLATWEACANAIEHAVDSTNDHVKVDAEVEGSVARVVVEDTGRWGTSAPRENRGLGLRLIESLVTSVDITPGGAGTRVTIEMAFSEPTAAAPDERLVSEQPDE
jgi:anti-sigma regulatory factor (Ser/Thr protein kinase)